MKPASETPVIRLATEPYLIVDMNQTAAEVRATMNSRNVLYAAVSQNGRITAVLDRRTLNRWQPTASRGLRIRDVVHPGMACLPPTATAAAAARLMRVTGSAAVPVIDEHHRLIGLVTAHGLAEQQPR